MGDRLGGRSGASGSGAAGHNEHLVPELLGVLQEYLVPELLGASGAPGPGTLLPTNKDSSGGHPPRLRPGGSALLIPTSNLPFLLLLPPKV